MTVEGIFGGGHLFKKQVSSGHVLKFQEKTGGRRRSNGFNGFGNF
jgi:hypothetical protein